MSEPSEYAPPKVWTWNKANGGRFANINRPSRDRRTKRSCRSAVIRCSFIRSARPTA